MRMLTVVTDGPPADEAVRVPAATVCHSAWCLPLPVHAVAVEWPADVAQGAAVPAVCARCSEP